MYRQQQRIRSLAFGLQIFLLAATVAARSTASSGLFGTATRFPSSSLLSSDFTRTHPFQLQLNNNNNKLVKGLLVRGGALSDGDDESGDESDYSEEEEEESDDDENLFGLDEQDFDNAEDEFAEENTVDRMIDAWKKTPPLTKSYLTASFAATFYGYAMNKNEFPTILTLEWQPVLKRMQLWRPLTAFLNFGPLGLGYIMTAHFVWTYMSTLERLHHSKPYDFWIMILFGQLCMVIGYPIFKLSPKFLGHNLSTFLVYIWSRFHEGMEVNLFELFNTKAEMLPWFFLAQTFLLEGEPPVLDFLGIVFGHVYHHCKTVGLLRAPPALVAWYNGDSALAKDLQSKYRVISQDFEILA